MVLSLSKNKWFWLGWLILSLSGGLVGYILSQENEKVLKNSQSAICIEYRNLKHPSILGISKLKYQDEYLAILLDTNSKTTNIPFTVIDNNQVAKIIGFTEDSTLVNIAITRKKNTGSKPQYEELWLYKRFVVTE